MKTLLTGIIALSVVPVFAQTEHLPPVPDPELQKMNEESQRHHNFFIAGCVIQFDKGTPEYIVESFCGPADKRTGEHGQVDQDVLAWKVTSVYDLDKDGFVVAGYANGKLFAVVSSTNIAEAIQQGSFFEKNEKPPGTAYSLEKSFKDEHSLFSTSRPMTETEEDEISLTSCLTRRNIGESIEDVHKQCGNGNIRQSAFNPDHSTEFYEITTQPLENDGNHAYIIAAYDKSALAFVYASPRFDARLLSGLDTSDFGSAYRKGYLQKLLHRE